MNTKKKNHWISNANRCEKVALMWQQLVPKNLQSKSSDLNSPVLTPPTLRRQCEEKSCFQVGHKASKGEEH